MLSNIPVDMPLTAEDRADLEEFLDDTGGMAWAAGYFAALTTGPDLVAPTAWLAPLLGDEAPEDNDEIAATLALLLAFQGEIRKKLDAGDTTFCPDADDTEEVGEFCEGFLDGARLQVSWGKDDEATRRLFTFAVLAGEVRDADVSPREGDEAQEPDAVREQERKRLGARVLEIRDYWATRKAATREPVRVGPKVGRNDPCPCGSGKKHKKCCLA